MPKSAASGSPDAHRIEDLEKVVAKTTLSGGSRFIHLDMARGIAALMVCAAHLRYLTFKDYAALTIKLPVQDKIFYFLTTLGHQAVVIFFVLSGFFVAGSVVKAFEKGTWSWIKFAAQRLTRLYVVLIPALLLTLYWDDLSRHFSPAAVGIHDLTTFFGSLIFLQTIYTPTFGTNGVLWSLAYEFWYYLMFPLAFIALSLRQSTGKRISHIVLFLLCVLILPASALKGFVVWLMGYGAYVVLHHRKLCAYAANRLVFIAGSLGLAAVLILIKRPSDEINWQDFLIGISFTLMVPWLAKNPPAIHSYRILALILSDISYTLYSVHFPVVQFIHHCFVRGKDSLPSIASYAHYVVYLALILLYAAFIWWLFEYRTGRIRKFFAQKWPILDGPARTVAKTS